MGDWPKIRFEEMLIEKSISYGIVQPGPHRTENSVPIIRVQNIKSGRIVSEDFKRVAVEIEEKYKKTRLRGGELLITVVGSVGETAITTKEYEGWNVARAVSVAKILPQYDKRFVRYCFATDDMKFQMYGNTNDTVQPTLNLKELKTLMFPNPSLKEQKAIAGVLSSLDDKIELLHRQNKTLEALAETLFRYTFIDNAQEDWEEKPLDKIANFLNGLACQKFPAENEDEQLPVLKIRELRGGISESSDKATSKVDDKYIVTAGDIIFSWSASLMIKIWDGEKCVLNQHLFKVTSDRHPDWLIYLWTKHHMDKFIAIAKSKATTMGHIKRSDLSSSMTIVPENVSDLDGIDKQIRPLFEKLRHNNSQISTLESLRDTLLPKLMSGDIRVNYDETLQTEAA